MKKVRFETPVKSIFSRMDESERHSPRPFLEKQVAGNVPDFFLYQRVLPYSDDPVARYESSNSSPYPTVRKTCVPNVAQCGSNYIPSNDLELSMLDSSDCEPRRRVYRASYSSPVPSHNVSTPSCLSSGRHSQDNPLQNINSTDQSDILLSKENTPPNVLSKNNSFFLKRENLDKYLMDAQLMQKKFDGMRIDKENKVVDKNQEIVTMRNSQTILKEKLMNDPLIPTVDNDCQCHHCTKAIQISEPWRKPTQTNEMPNQCVQRIPQKAACSQHQCPCLLPPPPCYHCNHIQNTLKCQNIQSNSCSPISPQSAVDKKNWAIKKFEQSNKSCTELEKQTNISKEKREPTVADLFKIIKLQNEQLQLLQEKVDKFISNTNQTTHVQNIMTEQVALKTVDEHKISIGVMTSFEMVRTSTVINKEIVKQSCENAQIQCNRSEISIKEVISKSQPVNLNFLDGIMPVTRAVETISRTDDYSNENGPTEEDGATFQNVYDDKTLNELSLYNVQVDNAVTPLISPEQSLYLDVRDYSDSDSGSDTQSNVGWTYYNKVMNRVNGILQDSDMPSSASALCRNTRQQCVQMQIDKTNVSVTKRVKFGDDPLGVRQPHIYAASTDTSLKMNQLAAKYLTAAAAPAQRAVRPSVPIDMSFATRNYMERHKILQGVPSESRTSPVGEMPRFLDITALRQQPKFL